MPGVSVAQSYVMDGWMDMTLVRPCVCHDDPPSIHHGASGLLSQCPCQATQTPGVLSTDSTHLRTDRNMFPDVTKVFGALNLC